MAGRGAEIRDGGECPRALTLVAPASGLGIVYSTDAKVDPGVKIVAHSRRILTPPSSIRSRRRRPQRPKLPTILRLLRLLGGKSVSRKIRFTFLIRPTS